MITSHRNMQIFSSIHGVFFIQKTPPQICKHLKFFNVGYMMMFQKQLILDLLDSKTGGGLGNTKSGSRCRQ